MPQAQKRNSYRVQQLKTFALENGAELVGIASADRFDEAPEGHKPEDILPGAKSVVVCAKIIPSGAMEGAATAYHRTMQVVHDQLDHLGLAIALFIEESDNLAVVPPSDEPYRHWEQSKQYGRGDLSQKHAAQAAGLGQLGKNSLLITPQYGNRVHLVSIVTNADIKPDPLMNWKPCPKSCELCINICPVNAIKEKKHVDQKLCRSITMEHLPRGYIIESCWKCRYVCPAGEK